MQNEDSTITQVKEAEWTESEKQFPFEMHRCSANNLFFKWLFILSLAIVSLNVFIKVFC